MPERPVPGARLPDRSEGSTKALRPADTSHNAPLLIRLVRYPYALPTARPGRIETGTRGTAVREGLEPRTPTHELLAEARVDTAFGNPMRGLHDRPEFRPHPFARIRAARDEEGSR